MSVAALGKRLRDWRDEVRQFDWNDLLDPETIGAWPGPVRLLLTLLLFAGCLAAGYALHVRTLQGELERSMTQEEGLRAELRTKAGLAVNLEAYRQQMQEMEEGFNVLLRQLPGQTEVPGLLEDITFTGLGSGLEFSAIQLQDEVEREFYVELPISIRVSGGYHDFGSFVSGVASLSRIVTLHDFSIVRGGAPGTLNMTIAARTYRYRPDD